MAWYDTGAPVDIGGGMTITPAFYGGEGEGHGELIGLHEGHFDAEGRSCMGMVNFADTVYSRSWADDGVPITTWTVEQLDPLTISPSVLCRRCGNHGFIRGGVWEPA